MQRSISNKNPLTVFTYILLFIVYESLSSIYLFLPPLLAVLFVLFINALKKEDTLEVFLILFCLIIYEAQMGYHLFSLIIYFSLIYKFVMPKIVQNSNCKSCINALYVLIAYLGYFIFCIFLSNVFLLPAPSINYYIIYYIAVEFFIVAIL